MIFCWIDLSMDKDGNFEDPPVVDVAFLGAAGHSYQESILVVL